jgi:predicted metal-dependent phosphoesterase TrpH
LHGVEISAMWSNMTLHIVGLNVDKDNPILRSGLKQHQDFRKIRAEKPILPRHLRHEST